MKILLVVHAIKGGGAERVAVNLANKFVKDGHEVALSCDTQYPFAYSVDKKISIHNHREGCDSTHFWSKYKWYRFARMERNYRIVANKVNPDVIISFMTEMNIYLLLSLIGTKYPIIVTEHTNVERMAGRFNKIMYKYTYPFAAAVTVLTHYDLKKWRKRFRNVVCMPNPIPIEKDPKVYNNRDRNKVVLAAGRVDAWNVKGFDNLIRVWNLIYSHFPGWELHIAGNYEECSKAYLESLMDHGAYDSIKFIGFRKDIGKVMSQSEIFVLSSRWEGLPMGLMEAMNQGCCCVAFDVKTGPSDIIKNYKSGILVKNQDVDELAVSLSKVIENYQLRQRLANNAHESVLKFSEEAISQRWYLLFDKILKKS